MKHISQSCPKCDFEHWIRIDKLGLQMRCKECNTSFYLDEVGRCVQGKRPLAMRNPHLYGDPSVDKRSKGSDSLAWLDKVPVPVQWGVGVLVLLGLGWFGVSLFAGGGIDIPNEVVARSTYVAEALARNDSAAISKLTVPGSGSAGTWAEQIRPDPWTPEENETIKSQVELLFEREKQGMAMVQTIIYAPGPGNAPDRKFIDVGLMWVKSDGGEWLLDTKRSAAGN